MALDDSVLSELLEMFRAGDGLDLIREPVRLVVQELIETEAAEVIGAKRYERNEARSTERNGHRSRLLATQAGDIELKIPKLRAGSFFPSLLEPRRRIDRPSTPRSPRPTWKASRLAVSKRCASRGGYRAVRYGPVRTS
jgi:transposase-like protein